MSLFEKRVKLKFKNRQLLNQAFCHSSYVNENANGLENNERLEFLGDSVLGAAICSYLFTSFPNLREGELARLKSFLVSEESLSQSALRLKLNELLLLGKGEEKNGGKLKKALLADCMEALFGACFLEFGYDKSARFVLAQLKEQINLAKDNKQDRDYKTLLQESCQKKWRETPIYKILSMRGPEHEKIFTAQVFIQGKLVGNGEGKNKKEAERAAAKDAYLAYFS